MSLNSTEIKVLVYINNLINLYQCYAKYILEKEFIDAKYCISSIEAVINNIIIFYNKNENNTEYLNKIYKVIQSIYSNIGRDKIIFNSFINIKPELYTEIKNSNPALCAYIRYFHLFTINETINYINIFFKSVGEYWSNDFVEEVNRLLDFIKSTTLDEFETIKHTFNCN